MQNLLHYLKNKTKKIIKKLQLIRHNISSDGKYQISTFFLFNNSFSQIWTDKFLANTLIISKFDLIFKNNIFCQVLSHLNKYINHLMNDMLEPQSVRAKRLALRNLQ